MSDDPVEIARKLAESYRNVRFGRGVVGKTSHATLALFAAWVVVIIRLSADSMLLNGVLLGSGLICTGVYLWWVKKTHQFATKNPGLALMEGAQLLEYQKWAAEVKGIAGPLKSPVIADPSKPPLPSNLEDGER